MPKVLQCYVCKQPVCVAVSVCLGCSSKLDELGTSNNIASDAIAVKVVRKVLSENYGVSEVDTEMLIVIMQRANVASSLHKTIDED